VGNDAVSSAKIQALGDPGDCGTAVPTGQACMCSDANYLPVRDEAYRRLQ
jgi:hypothetical protein